MRMRFKPYAKAELEAADFVISEPQALRGSWHEAFAEKDLPLYLELGCGKGGFIAQLAAKHSKVNFVGIDITDKVLITAKRKVEAQYAEQNIPTGNVRLLCYNIENIGEIFAPSDTVSRIYINFCNPWNRKQGHKKHRLTHTRQLLKYLVFLAPDGEIYFKTDNDALFEDSLKYFEEAGMALSFVSRDLHADEPAWNIRTEHEQMYSAEGIKIKALIARDARGKVPQQGKEE